MIILNRLDDLISLNLSSSVIANFDWSVNIVLLSLFIQGYFLFSLISSILLPN
jgi:hypothetical protein